MKNGKRILALLLAVTMMMPTDALITTVSASQAVVDSTGEITTVMDTDDIQPEDTETIADSEVAAEQVEGTEQIESTELVEETETIVTDDVEATGAKESSESEKIDYRLVIHFDGNGATEGSTDDMVITSPGKFTMCGSGFSREYHTFVKWDSQPDGSGQNYYADKEIYQLAVAANNGKEITLYAIWKTNRNWKRYVTFDGNGATSGSMDKLVLLANETQNLPKNKFVRKGYTFAGWNTSANGKGEAYEDEQPRINTIATEEYHVKTVTFYAQWKAVTYPITYNLNGGKNSSKNPKTYISAKVITLKNPTRSGYYFAGWYSDKKMTKVVEKISKGSTGTKTVYAKWVKKTKEYKPTSTSATLAYCKATAKNTITVKAKLKKRIKSSDSYYYLVTVNPDNGKRLKTLSKVYKNSSVTFKLSTGDNAGYAFASYAIAVKSGKSYKIISKNKKMTNPEKLAANTKSYKTGSTKKGLQTTSIDQLTETKSKNAFMNLNVSTIMNSSLGPATYRYNGKNYTFCDLGGYRLAIQQCNAKGINVSLQINLDWGDGSYSDLIAAEAREPGHMLYAWNTDSREVRTKLEAMFCYLGEMFGQSSCHVDNWVLGNEVNSNALWNYSGNMSKEKFIDSYATAFNILYTAVKINWSNTKVFTCVDHCWNVAEAGYSAKDFLTSFATAVKKKNSSIKWNVAFHPYPHPLTSADFWNNPDVSESEDTAYITMENISVLTSFIKRNYGSKTRIILSEQGYTSNGGQNIQAAAIAYAYNQGACDPMIDAVIFRSYSDEAHEVVQGLSMGISGKEAFNVYKYMDGKSCASYTDKYLGTIGVGSWSAVIKNYKKSRLYKTYRKE